MAQINVENMEENADLFMAKMGFPHDADGLNMTDEQLVNFVLLCQQEYMLGDEYDDEEYEHDCDCEHGMTLTLTPLSSGISIIMSSW